VPSPSRCRTPRRRRRTVARFRFRGHGGPARRTEPARRPAGGVHIAVVGAARSD
jgi:hypothetical protein